MRQRTLEKMVELYNWENTKNHASRDADARRKFHNPDELDVIQRLAGEQVCR